MGIFDYRRKIPQIWPCLGPWGVRLDNDDGPRWKPTEVPPKSPFLGVGVYGDFRLQSWREVYSKMGQNGHFRGKVIFGTLPRRGLRTKRRAPVHFTIKNPAFFRFSGFLDPRQVGPPFWPHFRKLPTGPVRPALLPPPPDLSPARDGRNAVSVNLPPT